MCICYCKKATSPFYTAGRRVNYNYTHKHRWISDVTRAEKAHHRMWAKFMVESKTRGKQGTNEHQVECWFLRWGRPECSQGGGDWTDSYKRTSQTRDFAVQRPQGKQVPWVRERMKEREGNSVACFFENLDWDVMERDRWEKFKIMRDILLKMDLLRERNSEKKLKVQRW